MNPFFSVVVPVYNVAPYLRACLDSLLEAERTLRRSDDPALRDLGVEIICIDDGSTDEGGRILDEYREKLEGINGNRFSFAVIHQPNAGLGPARNVGLDRGGGEYILFVDSDDSVVPDYFQVLWSLITKASADLVEFSYSEVFSQDEDVQVGDESFRVYNCAEANGLRTVMIHVGSMYAWRYALRREVIGGVRFLAIQPGEDVLFACEIVQRIRSFAASGARLYRYLRRPGSTMNSRLSSDFVGRMITGVEIRDRIVRKWTRYHLIEDVHMRDLTGWCAGGLTYAILQLSGIERNVCRERFLAVGRQLYTHGIKGLIFRYHLWCLWLCTYHLDWKIKVFLLNCEIVRWLKGLLRPTK